MKSRKIRCLIILLITVILLLTSCGETIGKDEITMSGGDFHLTVLEPNGVVYVKGIYSLAPYYSPNGKLCHYVDGEIVEID